MVAVGDNKIKRTNDYKHQELTLNKNGSKRIMQEKLSQVNQWYGLLVSVVRWCANKYEVLRKLQ